MAIAQRSVIAGLSQAKQDKFTARFAVAYTRIIFLQLV